MMQAEESDIDERLFELLKEPPIIDDRRPWDRAFQILAREIDLRSYEPFWFMTQLGSDLDNLRCDIDGQWLLIHNLMYYASENGNESALKIILSISDQCEFNVNHIFDFGRGNDYRTAAYVASENGHAGCVKLLRSHGAWMRYSIKYKRKMFDIIEVAEQNGYKL